LAAGGYVTVKTLGSGFDAPNGVAIKDSGHIFVADTYHNAVKEILVTGLSVKVNIVPATGLFLPTAVALDSKGNLFIADTFNNAVKETPAH
jgi:hypothetical protein